MKESVMMERDSKGRFVKKNNTPANNRHSIRDSKGRFVSAKEVKPDINEQAFLPHRRNGHKADWILQFPVHAPIHHGQQ